MSGSRPIFIEFSGSPYAGKSALIKHLSRSLRGKGISVKILVEEAALNPLNNDLHPNFNIWNVCQTLSKILEALESTAEVILIDRGLFDFGCWMDFFKKRKFLTQKEYEDAISFFQTRFTSLIDLVVVLKSEPHVSITRGYQNPNPAFTPIINNDVLKELNRSIDSQIGRNKKELDILEIDASKESYQEQYKIISQRVTEAIEEISKAILTVPLKDIQKLQLKDGLITDPKQVTKVLNVIKNKGRYVRRELAETSDNLVQPISAVYLTHNGLISSFKRTKHDTTTHLQGKYTVWIGSHINFLDQSPENTYQTAAIRGIAKKLILNIKADPKIVGIVIDRSNPHTGRHLGIIQKVSIPNASITTVNVPKEHSSNFHLIKTDKAQTDLIKMEPWSQALVSSLAKVPNA